MKDDFLFVKEKIPCETDLVSVLEEAYPLWHKLNNEISRTYGEIYPEWKFYSQKSGWTRKTMLGNRNLFFFKPCEKYFRIIFVFGDNAVRMIEESTLPKSIKKEIRESKKYAEGRGLTWEIKADKDLSIAMKLIEIKIKSV